MFRLFHNQLTSLSNHYLDWSRVGELLYSGTHRYSMEQVITRGIIISCTAVSAYIGNSLNDEKTSNCSNLTVSIAAGGLGFTLSHAVVIYPLIKKRREMSQECDRLKSEILQGTAHDVYADYHNKIDDIIKGISDLSLSDDKHSRASETWGRRKALLINLNEYIKSEEMHPDLNFWDRDITTIIDSLNDSPSVAASFRR